MSITIEQLHKTLTAIWGETSSNQKFEGHINAIHKVAAKVDKVSERSGFPVEKINIYANILKTFELIDISNSENGMFLILKFPKGVIAALGTAQEMLNILHKLD